MSTQVKHTALIGCLLVASAYASMAQHRDSALMAQQPNAASIRPVTSILIPLYLDSAFSGSQYLHGNSVPKYLLPSIEFYNGVYLASEKLKEDGIQARIRVIDSKNSRFSYDLFRDTATVGHGIVIAVAENAAELKTIADILRPTKSPLISIYPNDGGITNYPEFMMVNSSLKTHCIQLYKYIQRYHATDKIVLLEPSGVSESRMVTYLKEAHQATSGKPLNWQFIKGSDDQLLEKLPMMLDSNFQNVVIAPTLNANLAHRVIRQLSTLSPTYRSAVFGMPTWDNLALNKAEFKGVDVFYSTAFVTQSGNAALYDDFVKRYRSLTFSRPSDMAFRGYELTYRFAKTIAMYGEDFIKHINDPSLKVFTDFNFQPASTREYTGTDYFENQKVYFIQKTDGVVKNIM